MTVEEVKRNARPRARDVGVTIGTLPVGPLNAITDVAGVLVGHTTLIGGDNRAAIRTGVTVIRPHAGMMAHDPLFAGFHRFNGNGEMTGVAWIEESGLLTSPIAITNTHSVGVVRDAIIGWEVDQGELGGVGPSFGLPVVAETYDGLLNDINGFHVRPEHLVAAIEKSSGGPVDEGNVGGGTGMICHRFKGGIGTSSRVVTDDSGVWTVGALVQANYGDRDHLRIDGVPVGQRLGGNVVPEPEIPGAGDGSIIVILATDAPLLPHQCSRLAQRATVGLARVGGYGSNGSGDLFLAFSTGNRSVDPAENASLREVQCFPNSQISGLFAAAAEASEEAIVNALFMAETMTGKDGVTVHALPIRETVKIVRSCR